MVRSMRAVRHNWAIVFICCLLAIAAAGLATWALIDFLNYQAELAAALGSPTGDASWREAEAAQHAAGFSYGTMLFAAFALLASVVGVVVVGMTLKATTDLAFFELRPWVSIVNVRDLHAVKILGKVPAEFQVSAKFDLFNNGRTAATAVTAFTDVALDGDLENLKVRLHQAVLGGALTNIAPDRSLTEIDCSLNIADPTYHAGGSQKFILGIRVIYAAGTRGGFESSLFVEMGMKGTRPLGGIVFGLNGNAIPTLGSTTAELDCSALSGGKMT